MHLSDKGKHFIQNAEGLRLKSYYCPAGKLTIGYGHLVRPGEPQMIDQIEADRLFLADIARFENEINIAVDHCISTRPNQNQFDAMVAFIYNIGIGAWRGSTARRDFIASEWSKIPNEMTKWIHDDHGQVIAGLVNRRHKEIQLYEGNL